MDCPNLTTKDIYHIMRQCVIDYPYQKCKQINTFSTIHDGQLFTQNIEKTYQDFLDGFFWSRNWANAGANPNALCKQYPILGLEHKKSTLADFDAQTGCDEMWLILVDDVDCSDCPKDCHRSRDAILCDLKESLFAIMDEFRSYEQFLIEKAGDFFYMWAAPGRVQKMLADGDIDGFDACGSDIESHIANGVTEINEWAVKMDEDVVGWAVKFNMCNMCNDTNIEFNYENQSVATSGMTKCNTCK